MYILSVVDFGKYGLNQEEGNSILYQRRQSVWSKKSAYTLNFLPKHARHYKMPCISCIRGSWKRGNLRRWVLSLYSCMCVCVMSLAALQLHFPVCSGGLVLSLCDTYEADTLGHNWYTHVNAGRNSTSPWEQWGVTVALRLCICVLTVSKIVWAFLVCFLCVSRKEPQKYYH